MLNAILATLAPQPRSHPQATKQTVKSEARDNVQVPTLDRYLLEKIETGLFMQFASLGRCTRDACPYSM